MRATILGLALAATVATSSAADDHHPAPTIPWLLAQAVPSPEIAFGDERSVFGLRWQVTPFLYSWGVHRNAPRRWRAFVVEASMRHTGSFEVYGSPEWLRDVGWFARAGVRGYFPLIGRGEALCASIGASAWTDGHRVGPTIEAGVHVLFGLFGILVSRSPGLAEAAWTATLQVRIL